jgi:membrane protein YqaA with SNARE-associated domain
VIGALLGAVLYGFASAFVPVLPAEPYLAGMVATFGTAAVPLGIAAAIGQTLGKLVIFLATRGLLRSSRLRSRLDRRHSSPGRFVRLIALLDRPALAVPVLLLSGVVGFPPLLLVSVYAARTSMSALVFAVVCFVGRSVRFVLIALAPHLVIE